MRHTSTIALVLLGLLAGCAAPERYERVRVLITPAASRAGLPQPPSLVASKRDEEQSRRAEAAYAERIDGVARALVPDLRRIGARGVSIRRPHAGPTHIRAAVPRDAIPALEDRSDVDRVIRLVRHTGRVERRDLALVLTTDAGKRYELRGVLGLRARGVDGARAEVEGEEWHGAVAPPPVPGLPTFVVFDWRRLP